MPGNVSVTSLANRALAAIGGKANISSLTENSAQANACNLLFSPTFQQLARSAYWNCLQKQVKLSLLLAAAHTPENPNATPPFPPFPYLYQYLLPPDCLKARALIPSCPNQSTGGPPLTTASVAAPIWIRGMGQIPFKVAYATDINNNPETVILTNLSQAQLLYTVDSENPVIWDSQFQAAFVASLAAFLVPALSLHMPLMQANVALADRLIAEARASDSNEGTNSQDHTPDFIRARSGGADGFYSGSNGGYYGGGWDSMAWPAYGA